MKHDAHIYRARVSVPAMTRKIHHEKRRDELPFMLAMAFGQPRELLLNALPELFRSTPSLQKVLVVHVHESPEYVNPLPTEVDSLDELPQPAQTYAYALVHKPKSSPRAKVKSNFQGDACGPIYLEGQQWTGQFSADVQLWTRNGVTEEGQPEGDPVVSIARASET